MRPRAGSRPSKGVLRFSWRQSRSRAAGLQGAVQRTSDQYRAIAPVQRRPHCEAADQIRELLVMVVIAGAVHVTVLQLLLGRGANVGDFNVEVQVLAGQWMVAI